MGKYLCWSDPAKVFSCEFCEVFKNICFVECLQTAASELVRYILVEYFPFSEVRLEEEEEYKDHLKAVSATFLLVCFVWLKECTCDICDIVKC